MTSQEVAIMNDLVGSCGANPSQAGSVNGGAITAVVTKPNARRAGEARHVGEVMAGSVPLNLQPIPIQPLAEALAVAGMTPMRKWMVSVRRMVIEAEVPKLALRRMSIPTHFSCCIYHFNMQTHIASGFG